YSIFVTSYSYLYSYVIVFFYFFFFSSRRRHTRFDCDWSSDVCSSDLTPTATQRASPVCTRHKCSTRHAAAVLFLGLYRVTPVCRSEERRVGKECRARWWRYQ